MQNNKIQPFNFRRGLLASAVVAGMGVTSVQAIEIDTGNPDFDVRFDNTIKYNYGVRTENANKTILATPNSNDGDYNFRHAGTNITNRVDILSEFDVVFKESMGFRVSAAGWYDKAYENVGSNSNPFQNGQVAQTGLVGGTGWVGAPSGTLTGMGTKAPPGIDACKSNALGPITPCYVGNGKKGLSRYANRYYNGPSGEILDAFVFYSTEVGDESLLSFKVGQSNAFWGEALLNPVHSVSYGQSGLDLAKLASSPGTEAKELFIPRNQIFSSFTLNSEWTFAGQYFLDWDAARLPEAGTYYGFADTLGEGGASFVLGTSTDGFIAANNMANVTRGHDQNPDDRGDWGVQAKWAPEWLDGTLGFYYRNTSDILPQTWLNQDLRFNAFQYGPPAGLPAAIGAGLNSLYNAISTVEYGVAYGEDIDIYGISLSKNFGRVSVGSDLNIRNNMPLASIPAIFDRGIVASPGVAGSLCAPDGSLGSGIPGVYANGPARAPGTGCVIGNPNNSTFATGDTLHWVVNTVTTFANTPVFDSAVWIAEVGYSNLLSLDNQNEALYKGKSSYNGIDAPDRDNMVFSTVFTPTWYQVFPGIDMSAPVALNVGVFGNSPVQGGGNEDTGSYSLGVGAQIYNKYFVDLKYVDAFGKTKKCNNSPEYADIGLTPSPAGDGATPNALNANQGYACVEGGAASFSGAGAAIEDRGAVYLTFKTTI